MCEDVAKFSVIWIDELFIFCSELLSSNLYRVISTFQRFLCIFNIFAAILLITCMNTYLYTPTISIAILWMTFIGHHRLEGNIGIDIWHWTIAYKLYAWLETRLEAHNRHNCKRSLSLSSGIILMYIFVFLMSKSRGIQNAIISCFYGSECCWCYKTWI